MIRTIKARLPRLGKVRLGRRVENANGKTVPQASAHFILPGPGEEGHELISGRFDSPVDVLDVFFPVEDLDQVLDEAYKFYTAAGLRCRGDGEVGTYFVEEDRTDARGRAYKATVQKDRGCAAAGCPKAASGECKPTAMLNFCIVNVPGLGTWQLVTRSVAAIRSFRMTLMLARETYGSIVGVPFQLLRVPVQTRRGERAMTVVLRVKPEFLLGAEPCSRVGTE
jgi:hypothetical protein